jgi:hypothetical protein
LLGPDGQPQSIEVPTGNANRAERARLTREFQAAHPGYATFTDGNEAPQGLADSTTSRATYGARSESDCEGMASFRLRTLPEGWSAVGTVSGHPPGGGIGHAVAIVRAPDGRTFISSNGKPLIEVPSPGNAASIQRAVEAEFGEIYHGMSTDQFSWGIGTGTPDNAMRESSSRSTLHGDRRTSGNMPAEDYSRLAP